MQVIKQNNWGHIIIWVGRWGETFLFLLYAPRKSKDFCVARELIFFFSHIDCKWEREDISPIRKAAGWWYQGRGNSSLQQQSVLPLLSFTCMPLQGPRTHRVPTREIPIADQKALRNINMCWYSTGSNRVKRDAPSLHILQVMTDQLIAVQCYWTHIARCQLLISHLLSPTSPLLAPCQLTLPFLTAGSSDFIFCWLYSSCLDTTEFLLFLIMHFLAWSPLETSSSDNIRWPFLYYFPMVLFSPW